MVFIINPLLHNHYFPQPCKRSVLWLYRWYLSLTLTSPFTCLQYKSFRICSKTLFTCLQYKSFENTVGKGEIAGNGQYLLFPQCFLPVQKLSANFIKFEIVICKLFLFGKIENLFFGIGLIL